MPKFQMRHNSPNHYKVCIVTSIPETDLFHFSFNNNFSSLIITLLHALVTQSLQFFQLALTNISGYILVIKDKFAMFYFYRL